MSSLATIRRLCQQALGYDSYASSVASGGSHTTLLLRDTDSNMKHSGTSADKWDDAWLYLPNAAAADKVRQVVTFDATVASFIPNRAWGVIPANGDVYELFSTFDPAYWQSLINERLARLHYQSLVPLSIVPDADMEESGIVDWGGSSATLAKVTAGSISTETIRWGRRALQVVNFAANGYAKTAQPILVVPNGSYLVSAWVCGEGAAGISPKLVAWDLDNGAELANETPETSPIRAPEFLTMEITAKSTTRRLEIRLQTAEAAGTAYWDNVQVLPEAAQILDLPSWVSKVGQAREIYSRTAENFKLVNYGWHLFENLGLGLDGTRYFSMRLDSVVGGRYLWLSGSRPFPALSSETDTTEVADDLIKTGVVMDALERLAGDPAEPDRRRWEDLYKHYAKKYNNQLWTQATTIQPVGLSFR